MKFAKKYFMVDELTYGKLHGERIHSDLFEHPNVKNAKKEIRNMDDALSSDLDEYNKMRAHSESLLKFLKDFNSALTVNKKSAFLGEPRKDVANANNQTTSSDTSPASSSSLPENPVKKDVKRPVTSTKQKASKIPYLTKTEPPTASVRKSQRLKAKRIKSPYKRDEKWSLKNIRTAFPGWEESE